MTWPDVPYLPSRPQPELWGWQTFCKWLVLLLALRVFGADLLRIGGM